MVNVIVNNITKHTYRTKLKFFDYLYKQITPMGVTEAEEPFLPLMNKIKMEFDQTIRRQ